jgi:hypothetical protein
MSKLLKHLFLAAAIAAASSTPALADGDGGDNSMSPWTGESYAAFYGGNLGDFYTEHDHVAKSYPGADTNERRMVAKAETPTSRLPKGERTNPFRDDTGA